MAARHWQGKTVCCIASGPSLTLDDCKKVDRADIPVVAINNSWQLARFADVIYAGDRAWWDAYHKDIDIQAERWTCTRQAAMRYGINFHPALGGYNSGMRAIQFCLWRGASKVILLGYDCSIESGTHWHGDHQHTQNPDDKKVAKWHGQFAMVAAEAQARKANVVNCTRITALKAFRTGNLEEELCAASLSDQAQARTVSHRQTA